MTTRSTRTLGIIGGLGALGAADVFLKLVRALPSGDGSMKFDFVFEQHAFVDNEVAGDSNATQTSRKLYVFDMMRGFERRGVDAVLLPCFVSHTFLPELLPELKVPVLSMLDALSHHLQRRCPGTKRIGVLTSSYVRRQRLFERHFEPLGYEVVQPSEAVQQDELMPAIYGAHGIQKGHLHGDALDRLERSCRDVLSRGVELIVPGSTEIAIVAEALRARSLPVLDSNRIYATDALSGADPNEAARSFKIGVVGGVGPAATVDFLGKIVRNTGARKDQEHIKLVVEQNPQIPDRTANLVDGGTDPTISLYATCKKLESGGADIIAIPCNTAHAFVERIQAHLSIRVVNMLHETVHHLLRRHPDRRKVGLLATSGTLASRVYHDALEAARLELIVPDEDHQRDVMNAIYGERGVKAGFTSGECRDDLQRALEHLVEHGAEALILGCTELPLLISPSRGMDIGGRDIVVLDPTDILARRCVALARTADAAAARPAM